MGPVVVSFFYIQRTNKCTIN